MPSSSESALADSGPSRSRGANDRLGARRWVLLPFTALKAAGWVLVALLLAGVTGILRRT